MPSAATGTCKKSLNILLIAARAGSLMRGGTVFIDGRQNFIPCRVAIVNLNVPTLRRRQMRRPVVGSVLSLWLLAAPPALAQQGTAEIGGRITDEQGGALPGATVTLTNEETGGFREITSGADGSFFAPQLKPGRYRMVAKLQNFSAFERGGLILQVGQTLTINASLKLGSLQETVTVTGDSPVIDTSSTRVQQNFKLEALQEIPNSRDLWSLLAVTPSVTMSRIDVGGNRAIIEPGVTGLLFDLGDPGALAGALARVLDDPARARELGERARARAVERYDLTRLVAEEIELLKRLARSDR